MLYMGESTTPFDPRGRTRGKPSQLLLDNYKYLEYLYKYSIRLHQPWWATGKSTHNKDLLKGHVTFSV